MTRSVARAPTGVAFTPTRVMRVTTSALRAPSSGRQRQIAPGMRNPLSGIAADSSHAKKCSARATFREAKPITRVMDERERSDLTGRLRKAAEKTPYPYFLMRLEDIEAWLKAGFSVRSVWRIYSEKGVPFPGSYRSFLRYCREHCEGAPAARRSIAALARKADDDHSQRGPK